MSAAREPIERSIARRVIEELSVAWFTDDELIQLMNKGIQALKKDSALVFVEAPCVIFGDIHGNLPDFLQFFSIGKVEPQLLELKPPRRHLLFLGDYVDRGQFSLEVLALLVSLKLLFPMMVTLLRGNHEIDNVNEEWFREDILKKRNGAHLRQKPVQSHLAVGEHPIYKACNQLFSELPLCAIVSNAILCMHGGLPRGAVHFQWSDLVDLQKPRTHVEIDDIKDGDNMIVCDLLWADPTHNAETLELSADHKTDKLLFAVYEYQNGKGNLRYNENRDISIEFNDQFVEKFLHRFPNLRGIIRAHEHQSGGHRINEAKNLCTIFTAPRYKQSSDCGSVIEISEALEHIHFVTLVPDWRGRKEGHWEKQEPKTPRGLSAQVPKRVATMDDEQKEDVTPAEITAEDVGTAIMATTDGTTTAATDQTDGGARTKTVATDQTDGGARTKTVATDLTTTTEPPKASLLSSDKGPSAFTVFVPFLMCVCVCGVIFGRSSPPNV